MSEENVGKWIFVGICIGAALIAVLHGLPIATREWSFWLGSSGVAGAIAPIAASIAALVAFNTYRTQRSATRSGRFQKGVELLAGRGPVAIGGLHVIKDLALEDRRYLGPAIKACAALMDDTDQEFKDELRPFFDPAPESTNAEWLPSKMVSAEALSVIAKLRMPTGEWPEEHDIAFNGKIAVYNLYLCDKRFEGDNFSNIELNRIIMSSVEFEKCDFRNCFIYVVIGEGVCFTSCNLDGADITVVSPRGEMLPAPLSEACLKIVGSAVDCKVNGMSLAEWQSYEGPRMVTFAE